MKTRIKTYRSKSGSVSYEAQVWDDRQGVTTIAMFIIFLPIIVLMLLAGDIKSFSWINPFWSPLKIEDPEDDWLDPWMSSELLVDVRTDNKELALSTLKKFVLENPEYELPKEIRLNDEPSEAKYDKKLNHKNYKS